MDHIKEAFKKVKEDVDALRTKLNEINLDLQEVKHSLRGIPNNAQSSEIVVPNYQQTDRHINPTDPTDRQTLNNPFKPLKAQNIAFSTGNEGVPTDRQTDRQTDRHIQNPPKNLDHALEILNSLDSIKKEIRLKFKGLTDQEFLIFSTLYQLDDERGYSDYKMISQQLKLSESSIRDYIGKLIKKGIPVEKIKINNKTIHLSISKKLKSVTSLSTILQLRDL